MGRKIILIIITITFVGNHHVFAGEYEEKNVKISLVGDVFFDRGIGKLIADKGIDYPWEKVGDLLSKSDLALVNLETSIGVGGRANINKTYTFQSKPETLKGLVNAGIDGVSIANNHTLDYGEEGFIETLKNLENMGIEYAGGGRNIQDAKEPVIWGMNGLKIGFLAFSRVIPDVSWYANQEKSGIISGYDAYKEQVSETIADTKEKVDFLIVSLHWGNELVEYPSEKDKKFSKMVIDSGADLIMGHHPHVLQGIEFYKNKPIVYSLGNFIFNGKGKKSNQTMIFNIEINKEGIISTEIIPIVIIYGQPTIAQGEDYDEIIKILNTLSMEWNTKISSNGNIEGNITYVTNKWDYPRETKRNNKIHNTLNKISNILGYKYKYDDMDGIATLIKKGRHIQIDFEKSILTINNKEKGAIGFFESQLIHKPMRVICKIINWRLNVLT